MRTDHQDIRIGTIAPADRCPEYLKAILPHGFECFQLTFGSRIGDRDLAQLASECLDALQGKATISALGLYGNPLQDEQTAKDWHEIIKAAKLFGCSVVCGFTGALEDRPIDQSLSRFKEVFTPIAKLAEDEGVKIGFENCEMGGTWQAPRWNIAHSPKAWELMFNAVPSEALGLEWEPCHQMVSLIDPLPQLRKWVHKVVHVHGKDATIAWDVLKEKGLRSGEQWVWHRTPGFGDTNWTDVISILRLAGFSGSIDIEGWHDPVYKDELEMTGQVHAMQYLMSCRGGAFTANPTMT
jgi:sugar phosphate isomerase/epimerase